MTATLITPETNTRLEDITELLAGVPMTEPYVDKKSLVKAVREQNTIIQSLTSNLANLSFMFDGFKMAYDKQKDELDSMKGKGSSFEQQNERLNAVESMVQKFESSGSSELNERIERQTKENERLTLLVATQGDKLEFFSSDLANKLSLANESIQNVKIITEELKDKDVVKALSPFEVDTSRISHTTGKGKIVMLDVYLNSNEAEVGGIKSALDSIKDDIDTHSYSLKKISEGDFVEDTIAMQEQVTSLLEWKDAQANADLSDIIKSNEATKEMVETLTREMLGKIHKDDVDAKLELKFSSIIDHLQSALSSTEKDEADFKAVTSNLNVVCEKLKSDKADKKDIEALRKMFIVHVTNVDSGSNGGASASASNNQSNMLSNSSTTATSSTTGNNNNNSALSIPTTTATVPENSSIDIDIDNDELNDLLQAYTNTKNTQIKLDLKADKIVVENLEATDREVAGLKQAVDYLIGVQNELRLQVQKGEVEGDRGNWKGLAGAMNPPPSNNNSSNAPFSTRLFQNPPPKTKNRPSTVPSTPFQPYTLAHPLKEPSKNHKYGNNKEKDFNAKQFDYHALRRGNNNSNTRGVKLPPEPPYNDNDEEMMLPPISNNNNNNQRSNSKLRVTGGLDPQGYPDGAMSQVSGNINIPYGDGNDTPLYDTDAGGRTSPNDEHYKHNNLTYDSSSCSSAVKNTNKNAMVLNPGMSYGGGYQLFSPSRVENEPMRNVGQSVDGLKAYKEVKVMIEGADRKYYVGDKDTQGGSGGGELEGESFPLPLGGE